LEATDPVQYWLDTCKNPKTKGLYNQRFKSFESWIGKTGKELLNLRRRQIKSEDITEKQWVEKKAVDFYEELCGRMASHTAWSYVTAVRSFFATFGKEIQLNIKPFMKRAGTATPIAESQKHPFTQDELRKMFHVANLKEKTVLLFGVQTGLSAGELTKMKIEDFNGWLDKEPPIGPIEIVRRKEDTKIFLMVGRELAETLKQYFQSLKNEHPPQNSGWLFSTHIAGKRQEKHWKNSEPDRIIKRLARRANIQPLGKTIIRYHGLRAYFDDMCKTMGISQDHIDMMVGHKVRYNQAYTLQTHLRELYAKAEPRLSLSTAPTIQNHKRVQELEKQLTEQWSTLRNLISELEKERTKRLELEKSLTDILLIEMLHDNYRDEIIDAISSNTQNVKISEVFYDVTLGKNNVFIDTKGYINEQGKFVEHQFRTIKPKIRI